MDWLAWLAESKPESMFQMTGPHIKGRCPFHDDSTASFIVTPYKGLAWCFGCHKAFWNPIYFVAALNETSVSDALMFAKKRWGLSAAIPKDLFERVQAHEQYQRYKQTIMKFFADTLLQAISAYERNALDAEHFLWAKPTLEYLFNRKLGESAHGELVAESDQPNGSVDQYGVWLTFCTRELIGVVPPMAFVETHFGSTSEEFKFYRNYFAKFIDGQTYIGHLVFPYDDTPTSICRFKLREPAKPCTSQAWVEDAYETEMGGFRGFYGLRYYRTYLTAQEHGMDGPDKGFIAYLFEGEFDAMTSMAQQIRRSSDDYIAIGLSGGGAQSVDRLTSFGVQRARFVPDRDRGGVEFVKHVLDETKNKAISFRVFRWPDIYADWHDPTRPDAKIKDADDAIREVGYPRWVRMLLSEDSFSPLDEWCYDQATAEISRANAPDVQAISRICKAWGGLLRDEQVCSAFCTAIARDHEIDPVILRRDIMAREDNEEEFIKRLHLTLLEHYHPLGVRNAESRKRLLVLWHKKNRTEDSVVLNDERSAETLISRHYGPIYDFISATVGDPSFIVGDDEGESTFNVTMRAKKYREYLNYALLKMAQNLPSMDHAKTKAAGIHIADVSLDRMTSYMVNGRDVYVLAHETDKFTPIKLEGPSHGDYLFNPSSECWLPSVTKAEDLLADIDLVDLFNRVKKIIDIGWAFRNQVVDTTFLAAYVMCLSVMTVFRRQTSIILNAEHASGKSRFVGGLIGGKEFPRINLVAHATFMSGYTAASIRQQRDNSSLALCLDEFEDYGGHDAKSQAVRKVLELTRDLISESPVAWSVGTASGESKTYYIRCPLITCAIRPLRDAASLSRFVQFELAKDDSRKDPVLAITEHFDDQAIAKIRHEMAVGFIPHMLTLRQLQDEVEREYATGGMLPPHASSRFREAVYPIMVMLKFLGDVAKKTGRQGQIYDYRQFAYDFSESRKDQLARIKTTSQDEQIFETLMSAPIQVASAGDKMLASGGTNLRVMLSDLNKLDDINKTKRGVYIDTKMEWLIVNWVEAQQGLLAQTKYKMDTPSYLKDISQRSPNHIPTDEVKKARVLDRMIDDMGPCQPLELISVFSVKNYLNVVRARRDEVMAKPVTPIGAAQADSSKPQSVDDIVV